MTSMLFAPLLVIGTACSSGSDGADVSQTTVFDADPAPTETLDSTEADTTEVAAVVESPIRVRETDQYGILETADGRTIYGNQSDVVTDEPQCPNAGPEVCESFEPLLSETGATLPPGLDPATFGLIEIAAGYQIVHSARGLPLYLWADEGPGEYDGLGKVLQASVVTSDGLFGNDFVAP